MKFLDTIVAQSEEVVRAWFDLLTSLNMSDVIADEQKKKTALDLSIEMRQLLYFHHFQEMAEIFATALGSEVSMANISNLTTALDEFQDQRTRTKGAYLQIEHREAMCGKFDPNGLHFFRDQIEKLSKAHGVLFAGVQALKVDISAGRK